MHVWILNPFEELPVCGRRPLRYGTLGRVLSERGHSVIWWSSDFSHLTKTRRSVPQQEGKEVYRLVPTPPYKRHAGWARWKSHEVFARNFRLAALKAIETGEMDRPDVIFVSVPPLAAAREALELRRVHGCKVVIDIVDAWPETFLRLLPGPAPVQCLLGGLLFRPFFQLARRLYRTADGITATAQSFLDLPRKAGSNAPTHLTYLGVESIGPDTGEGARAKSRGSDVEKPSRSLRFVYIGAMGRSYDLETVLAAARLLKAGGGCFELHLAGTGPKEPGLRKLAQSYGLGNVVRFHGYLGSEQLTDLLASADVALNPIFEDSWIMFPYKLSEYLGAGLPVISSLPGECERILQDHDAGVKYQARNAKELAGRMKAYCEKPEDADRQGKNALRLAHLVLDRRKTYPKLASFLETIVAPTP